MEQRIIDLENKLEKNYKDQDKEQIYKYSASLISANPESLDVLEKHNITIKKPSQTIVLTIEPKELERQLKLAEEMGFIAAYQQNPRHITQPIEMVIKRMAKSDAVGITYKNENGIYASFIFSQRAFDYIMAQNEEIKHENVVEETPSYNSLAEIKEDALHVLETYAMNDKAEEIYARIDQIADKNLSEKEMLIEAFKIIDGDKKMLLDTIDNILAQKEERVMGKAI